MRNKRSNSSFFLFILFGAFSLILLEANMLEKQLTGTAVFHENVYQEWLQEQENPELTEEEKIKSTIDTYIRISLECRMDFTLFDFGFLFDKDDPSAYKDYAYERGFLYYALAVFRYYNRQISSYDYRPTYENIQVDEEKAKVSMAGVTILTIRKKPDRPSRVSLGLHKFELIKKDNKWLITNLECFDEGHELHGRDTDFNELVRTLSERMEKVREETEAARAMGPPKKIIPKEKSPSYRDYNRIQATQYALNHSSNEDDQIMYNLKFRWYSNDCQNFVSQCIWKGFGGIDDEDFIQIHYYPMINDMDAAEGGRRWWADKYTFCGEGEVTLHPWTVVGDFTHMIYNNWKENKMGV